MIKVGDKLPEASFVAATAEGPKPMTGADVFAGKKVALFAVPGAFTPTCSAKHLPGFKEKAADFRAKGVDRIACTSVNDAFVMSAWGKDQNVGDDILMLADGSAEFAKKVGLEIDLTARGLGVRSKRYAMAIDNGVVKILNVEDVPPQHDKSSAATPCSMVDRSL